MFGIREVNCSSLQLGCLCSHPDGGLETSNILGSQVRRTFNTKIADVQRAL